LPNPKSNPFRHKPFKTLFLLLSRSRFHRQSNRAGQQGVQPVPSGAGISPLLLGHSQVEQHERARLPEPRPVPPEVAQALCGVRGRAEGESVGAGE